MRAAACMNSTSSTGKGGRIQSGQNLQITNELVSDEEVSFRAFDP
jgi:hypothetical protein